MNVTVNAFILMSVNDTFTLLISFKVPDIYRAFQAKNTPFSPVVNRCVFAEVA